MASRRAEWPSLIDRGEDAEHTDPHGLLAGMQNGVSATDSGMESPRKMEKEMLSCPVIFFLGTHQKKVRTLIRRAV